MCQPLTVGYPAPSASGRTARLPGTATLRGYCPDWRTLAIARRSDHRDYTKNHHGRKAMPGVTIMSVKGGVGGTTVTATLAARLALDGQRVLVIDLCETNTLRLHLGMPWQAQTGLLECLETERHWREATWQSPEGAYFLPFGRGNLEVLRDHLARNPQWLADQFQPLLDSDPALWLLIAVPPASAERLAQAMSIASQLLLVTSTDPAAHIAVSREWPRVMAQMPSFPNAKLNLLVNRYTPGVALQDDLAALLRLQYGEYCFPRFIPEDRRVSEALARGRTVASEALDSAVATRIGALALWLKRRSTEDSRRAAP
ncbi:MAG: cellulose synthase operon protein YhjQ [Gammaproteobacteria bacterium]|nr:MAG: cellulose synthase operon protein YhjQ [Gammaproteobacteria bacterium]